MLARCSFVHSKTTRIQCTRLAASFSRLPPRPSSTDDLGLPLSPTWSVHELISSYPSPTLSDATLKKLYDSAALLPPNEDTHEFEEVKREMEDLVRLVEAVKMAPKDPKETEGPPDGRVWPSDRGIILEDVVKSEENLPSGHELLKHAQRTENGYYLVDRASTKA
jgi:Asp-tRNA(Asn)/Glu-tRNA(Gln) amidotransferase C subunit